MNEPKYGYEPEYKFELSKDELKYFTSKTRRSARQTQYLFQLVDGDLDKLKFLEEQIKNLFLYYSPLTKEKVDEILKMTPKTKYFKF